MTWRHQLAARRVMKRPAPTLDKPDLQAMHAVIPDRLFQSGQPGSPLGPTWATVEAHGVGFVVDLYGEISIPAHFNDISMVWPLTDDTNLPDRAMLDATARLLAVEIAHGTVVLVHCLRGRNRSSLVSARVLMVSEGISGAEAVRRIREAVPGALSNETFTRYLEGL
jgi:hypothetical protein